MPADWAITPQIEAEECVEPDGSFLPLVELGSIAEDVEPDLDRVAAPVPFTEFLGGRD